MFSLMRHFRGGGGGGGGVEGEGRGVCVCVCVCVCDTVIRFTADYYNVTYQVISYWTSYRSNTAGRGPVAGPIRSNLINEIFIN